MSGKKSKKIFVTFLFGILFFIIFLQNLNRCVIASESDQQINFTRYFKLTEYADNIGKQANISSININLPSKDWNVTEVELNFSNIKLGRQVLEVETESSGSKLLDKKPTGYAVQINITEPTTLFAVEIYGDVETFATTTNLTIMIKGFDSISYKPNSTVYGTTLLNMSINRQWYIQTFPSQIHLSAGRYFLVMNGTEMLASDNAKYYWYYNGNTNKTLYTWEYDNGWQNPITNQPFLYKLHQRVNRAYNPETINLTAEINGKIYNVSNGIKNGTGNLTVKDIVKFSPGKIFNIPIRINLTISLSFNLSFHISLKHSYLISGLVKIEEDTNNIWLLKPVINRIYFNYSVRITLPKKWTLLNIYKNDKDITSEVLQIGNSLLILNKTITSSSNWEIYAESPNVDFSIDVPAKDFEPEQKLKISVKPPISEGNLTFILIDAYDLEEYKESKEIDTTDEEIIFSYTFSSNPYEGTWKIFIYWNNNTAAGVQTYEIKVSVPFTLDPEVVILITVLIIISTISGISLYVVI
ncbi:MAG: hypothetical protein ACTSQG_08450, partial [Promethearchaeota archaeon]